MAEAFGKESGTGEWREKQGGESRPWATITADLYPECNRKPSEHFKLGSDMPNYLFKSLLWLCGEWVLEGKRTTGHQWNTCICSGEQGWRAELGWQGEITSLA